MSRICIAAVVLAGIAFAASGCGGSTKTSASNEPKTLTRNDLIAQADAICKRANDNLKTLSFTTAESYGNLLIKAGAYEQTAVAQLGKLVPPAEMANDWKQIVGYDQTLGQYTVQLGEYIRSHNTRAGREVFRASGAVLKPMTTIAKTDGFKDCVKFA
jgi:hypothetical protein